MNLSPKALFTATRFTLAQPAAAARHVMALGLSVGQGLMAVALTPICATLLIALTQGIPSAVVETGVQNLASRPFELALLQFAPMPVWAFLMWRVGQMFGGTGTFAQSLALIAWFQVVLFVVQIAGVLLFLIFPIFAFPVLLAIVFALFYLLTHFTAALNGFTSLTKTFFGMLGTAVLVLLLISIALVFILPVPPNV